jgi:hypothetical protein
MMTINFPKLKGILARSSAKTNKSVDSSDCLSEFTASLTNYIEKSHQYTEEELAYIIMSMQNWVTRKDFTRANGNGQVNAGEIYFADLGIGYKPEMAYTHPVIVLEKIGAYAFVVPTTTSSTSLRDAYHPTDNSTGNKKLRKVLLTEESFTEDCAIILSNVRTISQGRLLTKIGDMKNINDPNSTFVEIKDKAMQLCFPRQVTTFKTQIEALTNELEQTKTNSKAEYDKLKEDYDSIVKENTQLKEQKM